jgi:hypothetical protein
LQYPYGKTVNLHLIQKLDLDEIATMSFGIALLLPAYETWKSKMRFCYVKLIKLPLLSNNIAYIKPQKII